MDVRAQISQRLNAAFALTRLDITDDSGRHAGHAGALGGGGHYIVTIVSPDFAGKSALERHRLVYAALGDLMRREIHALALTARAPGEGA